LLRREGQFARHGVAPTPVARRELLDQVALNSRFDAGPVARAQTGAGLVPLGVGLDEVRALLAGLTDGEKERIVIEHP
jgi:hypothetical protein